MPEHDGLPEEFSRFIRTNRITSDFANEINKEIAVGAIQELISAVMPLDISTGIIVASYVGEPRKAIITADGNIDRFNWRLLYLWHVLETEKLVHPTPLQNLALYRLEEANTKLHSNLDPIYNLVVGSIAAEEFDSHIQKSSKRGLRSQFIPFMDEDDGLQGV